jgi:predicted nucleic acid-binding Zn ribbon protein
MMPAKAGSSPGRRQEADHVFAVGIRQPAAAHVVEQHMPLVPDTRRIAQLDAADHREMHALVAALGAELDRRGIFEQVGHAAEVFQVAAMAHQRAAAELADAVEGGRGLENDRRAAGRAVGAEKGMG